jgi:putative mRNA 3-end processing factor
MPLPRWLQLTEAGLACPPGGFVIDPQQPVARAVISHGHSDHARPGHGAVLTTLQTAEILRLRHRDHGLGPIQALAYGETASVGDVRVTLVPAGHILGSAQVVLDHRGERVVISGDYKRRADPTCAPFELVRCSLFITEATFALPVFHHPPAAAEVCRLLDSLRVFPERCHLIGVYALGKCQRLIALLREAGYDRPIYLHGALTGLCALYQHLSVDLGALEPVTGIDRRSLAGEIVLCPPSALADRWSRAFPEPVTGLASGWMRIRQRAKASGVELPLVISDHADWEELTTTLGEVGAEEVLVTHGREEALVHYAQERGLSAAALSLAGYAEEGE